MDIFVCNTCGKVVEYKGALGIIESGDCPECKPEAYWPPTEEYPYWMHKVTEATIINVTLPEELIPF